MTLEKLINTGIISQNQSVSILDESHPLDYSMHRFNLFNMSAINRNADDVAALKKYGKWKVCFMYTSHAGDPNQDNDIFIKLEKPGAAPNEVSADEQ